MRYNIEIRPLEICHLKMVHEMGRETIEAQSLASFDWTPEMLAKAYAMNESLQLGAFIKKKLIGYLIALQLEKDGPVKILGMGIVKDFRNKERNKNNELIEEIELKLLTHLMQLIKETSSIVIAIPNQNEYLSSVFKKVGFVKSQLIVEMKSS
jgi:hypothetical protein